MLVRFQDDETLEARDEAVDLYLDRRARRNADALVRPVKHQDVVTLELASPTAPPTLITTLDVAAFEPPAVDDPICVESEMEMLVDVAAPAFPVNNNLVGRQPTRCRDEADSRAVAPGRRAGQRRCQIGVNGHDPG